MFTERMKALQEAYERLAAQPNEPAGSGNGIYRRWVHPVLTREHIPPHWCYDFDPDSNPLGLERLGVNAVFNSGALYWKGRYYLAARVEGNDRKSFFALASSSSPVQGFRFTSIIELPDTNPEEVNVYDMRLTAHEDGWIYGLFCSESKDPDDPDPGAARAACGIVRTKDLQSWQRLPNIQAASQQRNVVLHPEFVQGKYALYTRPQDAFREAGSGGGICFALCEDIENAVIKEETLVSPRQYHQITEAKNGAGAVPIKTEEGWLHIAHGVRSTAAGLRYVLYVFVTDLNDPAKVTAQPGGFFMAPLGGERVGDVSNVLFCNGAAVNGSDVAIYYASSDTRLHVATTTIEALLDYAFNTPQDAKRSAGSVMQRKELIHKNEALLEYCRWLEHVPQGGAWREELEALAHDEPKRTEAFYRNLAFGTGGLRAPIGAGSNCMNHYVVGRVTQGLANYLQKKYTNEQLKACVACDTRRCSQAFAQYTAEVLARNGVHVYLFAQPRPTPMLSFAVRHFGAHTGVVITASHNPKEYNGYKAYNASGGQLTDEAAEAVLEEVNALDVFAFPKVSKAPVEITLLDEGFDEIYYAETEQWLPRREMSRAKGGDIKLLYSPLHGAGLTPVTQLLERLGYTDCQVVESQKYQDAQGSFPTVRFPNPEDKDAFGPAMEIARRTQPDAIFATDPDADRLGVLAKNSAGEYEVLTGTQTGALLCDYVIRSYNEAKGGLPPNAAIVTTIVTGTLAERICAANGVHTELVLTGFKYIGEKMDAWKASGAHTFLFGFEESYGYLIGDACRDKDAVVSSALVAEMALYYKQQGMTLYDALQALYKRYGPVSEGVMNVEAKGAAGAAKIAYWMTNIRKNYANSLPREEVIVVEDFSSLERKDLRSGETTPISLPKSNVLKLYLADGSWLVVRPSGTEPKIKLYACTDKAFPPGDTIQAAEARCAELIAKAKEFFAQ